MVRQITATFAALLLSTAMLSGCGTVTDGATQDVRINIAGTGEALCDMTQPGRRYRAYAPGSIRVMRSNDDLRLRCKAPGNREQVVILKSVVSDKFAYNAFNLGLGAAWDGMTGAMYTYPDTVLVDFSNMPATAYPQPDYQDVFDKYPELMQMEQFRPGVAALGSDVGTSVPAMKLRTGEEDNSMGIMMPSGNPPSSGASAPARAVPSIAPPVAVQPQSSNSAVPAPGTVSPGTSTAVSPAKSSSSLVTSKPSNASTKIFTSKVGQLPSGNQ